VQEPTLPDLLRERLDVVFVGINPSLYSVAAGHYFARKTNRFWPCFSRSVLSRPARASLGLERLEPHHDRALLEQGFGFTDVAKRPSARAAELTSAELAAGTKLLIEKLSKYRPRIACFHGVTGYRPFQAVFAPSLGASRLGLQAIRTGETRLFVVPNPSPANAHFTPADQIGWYDALANALAAPP